MRTFYELYTIVYSILFDHVTGHLVAWYCNFCIIVLLSIFSFFFALSSA